jgi:preprotein translocase subunit YajC
MTSPLAFLTILAQQAAPAAAPAQGQTGGQPSALQGLLSMAPMILAMVGLFFIMTASQRKKQKEHQKMLSTLDTGDEVITTAGIYGEITNKKEDRFVVRIADNTKIEVAKGFIQTVVKKANAPK